MERATTYSEWCAGAAELDALEGHEAWKMVPGSTEFDFSLLRNHLAELVAARAARAHSFYDFSLFSLWHLLVFPLHNFGGACLPACAHNRQGRRCGDLLAASYPVLELVCSALPILQRPPSPFPFGVCSRAVRPEYVRVGMHVVLRTWIRACVRVCERHINRAHAPITWQSKCPPPFSRVLCGSPSTATTPHDPPNLIRMLPPPHIFQ
jgi:hypothetical protein